MSKLFDERECLSFLHILGNKSGKEMTVMTKRPCQEQRQTITSSNRKNFEYWCYTVGASYAWYDNQRLLFLTSDWKRWCCKSEKKSTFSFPFVEKFRHYR